MAKITGYIDWNGTKTNSRFTFRVNDRKDAQDCIKRLQSKGNSIRAAWYFDRKKMVSPERLFF